MNTLEYLKLDQNKSKKVVETLQQLLADYQIYYTNMRGFHWDIKGPSFFTLHIQFEKMYNDAAEKVDEIAERILQLGDKPVNKFSDYLKTAKLEEVSGVSDAKTAVKHILDSLGHLIGLERKVVELASDNEDEVTVAIMDDFLTEQEKMVWMLSAYLS